MKSGLAEEVRRIFDNPIPLVMFALGFVLGATWVLFLLRQQDLIDDGLATLIGSFLGAAVTVIGAVFVSGMAQEQKRRSTRRSVSALVVGIENWSKQRCDEVMNAELTASNEAVDFIYRSDKDFAQQNLYVLEGILQVGHDVDLDVLPKALRLAAALKAFCQTESGATLPAKLTVRFAKTYRAIDAVKQVLEAAREVKVSLSR
jgi:hypothetical protein